jgi:hypothetical protein
MTTLRTCLRWLAALIVCALPALANADTFTFRNDCKEAVVVQVATVQRGVLKREQVVLKSGESTPAMPLDADKVITVIDARTGRIGFREVLRVSKTPLSYGIVPDPRAPGRAAMRPLPPVVPAKGQMPPIAPGDSAVGKGTVGPPAPPTRDPPAKEDAPPTKGGKPGSTTPPKRRW